MIGELGLETNFVVGEEVRFVRRERAASVDAAGRKPSDQVAYSITSSVACQVTFTRLVLPSSFVFLSRFVQGARRNAGEPASQAASPVPDEKPAP